MTLFILSYLAGVLTIASPCILPVLPLVLARSDAPFRRGSLPLLVGLALAFAAIASLAAVAGGWAVAANQYARIAALAVLALFGLSLLFPGLAARLMAPLVAGGSRLAEWAGRRGDGGILSSTLLGIATGLVWAPCAGPVLGLVLTGAALSGPSLETSLLLLTYGLGAASAIAAALILGRRLLAFAAPSLRWNAGARRLLGAAIVAGALAIAGGLDTGPLTRLSASATNVVERSLVDTLSPVREAAAASLSGPLATLPGAPHWLNTSGLAAQDLRGKVVVVNFWTYSCINCLRTLPHVRGWAEKYKDQGLVVIGVHSPEFAFEKDLANVAEAVKSLGIDYPVAIDNDFGIWRTFDNQAWPALYFIGADGKVAHVALGEGDYDESERVIQDLLRTAGATPGPMTSAVVEGAAAGEGAGAAPDLANLGSGETYIGYARARGLVIEDELITDLASEYRAEPALSLNQWSLKGLWTIGAEFAELSAAPGSLRHRFHARDLHLVMGLISPGQPIRFRVAIDGKVPGRDHGADTDVMGWGEVREHRLYQLVRQRGGVDDRNFEIEFFAPGVRAYAFTFG